MLQALIDGQHDPATLADLAKRRLRVDPRIDRGADRAVERPPRVPGADTPGGDRPAHRQIEELKNGSRW